MASSLKLVAELGGDGSGFERMMGRASLTAKQFGQQAIAPLKNVIAGVFTVGAISQLTRSTIEWASKLRDSADALGVNVEFLQKMQNGAKLVGADIEDITRFMQAMEQSREKAFRDPKGSDAKAFHRLGVTTPELGELSKQDLMKKIIEAFKNGSTGQLENDVMEVGSKAAKKLIGAFASQFESSAPILSEDLIDQLDDIGDEFTTLGQQIMVSIAPAIASLARLLVDLADALKLVLAPIGAFLAQTNKNVVTQAEFTDTQKKNLAEAQAKLDAGKISPERFKKITDLIKGVGSPDDVSAQTGKSILDDIQKKNADLQNARAAERAARRNRESSGPQFDAVSGQKLNAAGQPGDSLVKVGNFLGATPGAVRDIHEQLQKNQLDEQKKGNALLTQIIEAVKKNPLSSSWPLI